MCFTFTHIFPPTPPSSSMARSLPLNHLLLQSTTFSSSTSQVGFAVMSIFLCAFALLMCASHSMKRRRQSWSSWFFGEDPEPVIEIQNEASPAVMTVTTTSEAARSQQLEASIWQKNILMGGKCQLPDFSGVIIYDSEGNIVTPSKAPRPLLLTWK